MKLKVKHLRSHVGIQFGAQVTMNLDEQYEMFMLVDKDGKTSGTYSARKNNPKDVKFVPHGMANCISLDYDDFCKFVASLDNEAPVAKPAARQSKQPA